jgi:uncharacterized iron-regulated protein
MRLPSLLALLLVGCATIAPESIPDVPILLVGEQHDAPAHQDRHRQIVDHLAARGRLAALVVEMAEQGRTTAALPPAATEPQARAALDWDARAWPWEAYGPAVMAAVRAGVPVLGGNLPRERMRTAMADVQLDAALTPQALERQRAAIRDGHCGLLPESQVAPMARVQVARDRSMAQVLAAAAAPGKTVVLLAGAGHVDARLGVPQHLPRTLAAHPMVLPPVTTGTDYCAQLREQMQRRAP